MRATAAALLTIVVAVPARADIPSFPTRPEWDDTPLPMPDEAYVFALGATVIAAVGYLLYLELRDRRVGR
jgi:hypothetical protein